MPKLIKSPKKNHPYPAIDAALKALDKAIPNDVLAVVSTHGGKGRKDKAAGIADAVLLMRVTSKKRVLSMVNAFLDAVASLADSADDETMAATLKMMKLIWRASIGDMMVLDGQPGISVSLDPDTAKMFGKLPKVRARSREARDPDKDKKLYGHKTRGGPDG